MGSLITNRDNQSLQQLLRLGVRWVGGNFSALRQNLPLTPTHSETSLTCEHANSAGQSLETNMVRRFLHSGWRQVQKSSSFNTKQRSSLKLVLRENNSSCTRSQQLEGWTISYHPRAAADRPPLAITYHPKNIAVCNVLLRNYTILRDDDSTKVTFDKPPFKAFCRAKNPKDLLVHSSLPQVLQRQIGTYPCEISGFLDWWILSYNRCTGRVTKYIQGYLRKGNLHHFTRTKNVLKWNLDITNLYITSLWYDEPLFLIPH